MNAFVHDFISIFYPRTCRACENSLYKGEEILCTHCMYHLPKTNFHTHIDNPVARHFWGKVNINSAASFYFFNKGQKVQRLIHRLKYKGQKEIGAKIGEMYGNELLKSPVFNTVDLIIPVPLHKARLQSRGYNQSDFFAKGLAKSMNVRADTDYIIRTKRTESQTRKNRFSRWENVNEVFAINSKSETYAKHILLVDDVITTGATLTACAESLLRNSNAKVSLASIAYAHK